MDTFLPSQPESNKKLFIRSLKLYRAAFTKVILLGFLISLVVFIPRLISDVVGQDIFLRLPWFSLHRLWIFLINLIAFTFFIAIIWNMYCTARGIHEPLIEDMAKGLKKVVYVFIATMIQNAIIYAVLLLITGLMIILQQQNILFTNNWPGFIISVIVCTGQMFLILYVLTLFLFILPLIAIENKGIFTAIEKSVLLAWNHWWRIFSLQLSPWLVYLLVLILFRFVFRINIHLYFVEQPNQNILPSMLNLIIFAFFIPWIGALLLVQLKDLELRRELFHQHGKLPHKAQNPSRI